MNKPNMPPSAKPMPPDMTLLTTQLSIPACILYLHLVSLAWSRRLLPYRFHHCGFWAGHAYVTTASITREPSSEACECHRIFYLLFMLSHRRYHVELSSFHVNDVPRKIWKACLSSQPWSLITPVLSPDLWDAKRLSICLAKDKEVLPLT